ncbi:VOC family protein [Paraburkholderia sediminicola]|uniref:VOC family protein n=1 Tax=Paraburkholderia sediminicola TaxID=458836 RepID=UPI0038BD8155
MATVQLRHSGRAKRRAVMAGQSGLLRRIRYERQHAAKAHDPSKNTFGDPMSVSMTRLILYVRDVALLKSFYQTHFDLAVTEDTEGEWVVLKAGEVEIALHRIGEPYRDRPPGPNTSNSKIVFSVLSGLPELREKLVNAGVPMRNLKRYNGFTQLMCDGEDPEGNVFQLSQAD